MEDALRYADENGCLVVAAAGNDGVSELIYPASSQYVVSVGATDNTNQRTSFSNFGESLDLMAPGEKRLMLHQHQAVQEEVLAKHLPHLTPNEQTGLATFVNRLYQRYGTNLLRVILFGSKARGDFDEQSDLDVLVVVSIPDNNYWQDWRKIVDLAWDVGRTYGLIISSMVKNERDYAEMCAYQLLLARHIERDGIRLWTTLPSAHTSQPM